MKELLDHNQHDAQQLMDRHVETYHTFCQETRQQFEHAFLQSQIAFEHEWLRLQRPILDLECHMREYYKAAAVL